MLRINTALTTISLLFSNSPSSSLIKPSSCTIFNSQISRCSCSIRISSSNISSSSSSSSSKIWKRNVHLHGRVSLQTQYASTKDQQKQEKQPRKNSSAKFINGEIPIDPKMLSSKDYLEENVDKLVKWFKGKENILCITGAGISVDSGIPDYRGHKGSYHKGHKPMIHDQFISSETSRQRYWGRSLMGWKEFSLASPNGGHKALAKLEEMGLIGVEFDDKNAPYSEDDNNENKNMNKLEDTDTNNNLQKLSIITQNVDGLHRKAGTHNLIELHGRNDQIKCMTCGTYHCRHKYHETLEDINSEWIKDVEEYNKEHDRKPEDELRPDGDAFIAREVYDDIQIPGCLKCDDGFFKPDVVFFGDSVPKQRVQRCYAAVDASDGLFCIGSSLAVLSAYRFVQHAAKQGVPIAILNVGETRAEVNDLDVLKIEASASETLNALVDRFKL